MKTWFGASLTAVALIVAVPAAATPLRLYPVQAGAEQQRFRQGVPTLQLETESGAMMVTPLPFDHGHPRFAVAVYNRDNRASNFGPENVSASVDGVTLPLYSQEQLEHAAKTRATWTKVGMIALTGVAGGLAATQHNTYTASARGYGWSASAQGRDYTPGAIAAGQIAGAGAIGLASIQERLDFTLDHLARDLVQTTTVDPEASYGGIIELAETDKLRTPSDIRLVLQWNGQPYPFTFRLTHEGEAVPAPFTGAPAMQLAGFAARPGAIGQAATLSPARYTPAADADPYAAGRRAAAAALAASGGSDAD